MDNTLIFRNFNFDDLYDILNIYNFHIINSLANFEETPIKSQEFLKTCTNIVNSKIPFIVCEKKSKIIGFAFLSNFRKKSGYRFVFEDSIYLDKDRIGEGIGSRLLKELIISASKNKNIKSIIAVIGDSNADASIKIHEKNGFKMIGKLKNVGFKKKQWIDSIYMQLQLL